MVFLPRWGGLVLPTFFTIPLSATPTLDVLVLPMCVGDPVVGLRRRYSIRKPGGRLSTLRLPTRLGVPFKLFWFYYTQRRAGCPRSSPRRFAAIVGYADNCRFGFANAFWRSSCRLAPT
jgi:hypothetical protein